MPEKKIFSIQYIRGLSALAVVFCHYGMSLKFYPNLAKILAEGQLGIFTFFLISGFVIIYSLINNNYHPKNFFKFLLKRSLRIDPPYIIIIILFLLTFKILHLIPNFGGKSMPFIPGQFIAHLLYIVPFTKYEFYDHVFWTLSIEFQFYVLIGLLFFISENDYFKKAFLIFFSSTCFISFANSYYLIFNYAPVFATGMALVYYYKSKNFLNLVTLLACLFITFLHFNLVITILIIIAILIILLNNYVFKALHLLVDISYSLYITHTLLLILLSGLQNKYIIITSNNELLILFTKIILAVFGAYIYYLVVEKPSIKFSKHISIGGK